MTKGINVAHGQVFLLLCPSDEDQLIDRSQFDHLRLGSLSSLDKQELTLFLEIIPFSSGVVPLAASLLWYSYITLDHND